MKTNLTYYLVSLLTVIGMLTACTEDSTFPLSSQEKEEGRVILSYTVDGSDMVATRAPEKGNEERNENLVKELDLFIFRNGTIITEQPLYFTPEINDPQTGTYNPLDTGLSPDDIQNGDQVYLVANCHNAVSNVKTLEELKNKTIGDLICYDKQDQFVMDGKVTIEASMWTDKDLHIQINLKRAAAKVRLHFASSTDWAQVSYRFCHYANTATVLEQEETEEYTYVNDLVLTDYPTEENQLTPATAITENGTQCLVLYTYPNNWYSGNGNPEDDHLNVAPPINSDRETRILLRAPFDGKLYYYDIPVNFRLPLNNDATDIKFENYKDLYRIQRNHIYDITVTIDRAGGITEGDPETPVLQYEVAPYDDTWDVDVPAFN